MHLIPCENINLISNCKLQKKDYKYKLLIPYLKDLAPIVPRLHRTSILLSAIKVFFAIHAKLINFDVKKTKF